MLKISLNGKQECQVGTDAGTVITVIVSLQSRRRDASGAGRTEPGGVDIDVGGLAVEPDGTHVHKKWLSGEVSAGDEIRIVVGELGGELVSDEPRSIEREDPAAALRSRRAYYERLRREFEGE